MGFSLGSIGKVAGGLIGGVTGAGGAKAARRGARAQEQGMREAMDELDRSYNEQMGFFGKQRDIGDAALSKYAKLFGIGTPNGDADYSSFFESPGYQFTKDEGENALSRIQSARGNLFSGGAGRELLRYNTGLADQTYNQFADRLGNFANLAPQTNATLAGFAGQRGQGKANLLTGIGDARASGYVGAANSYSNAAGNLLSLGSSFVKPF